MNWNFSGAVLYGKTLYYVNGGRITWDYNGTADYNGVKYILSGALLKPEYISLSTPTIISFTPTVKRVGMITVTIHII